MKNKRCLYCYKELKDNDADFHKSCSKKFFGSYIAPQLNYSLDQMLQLGKQIIKEQAALTGVQPKLSLGFSKQHGDIKSKKLTIMGVWGTFILKPPTKYYPQLPELEDLTMHLAGITGIQTVPHTLIRLKSGELAYLTKRIDRKGKRKFSMEDMCQLTGKLTEAKYRGSYEQIGKAIIRYSVFPGLDIVNFFEILIFSFLTGNNDMHLKNFSLFKDPKSGYKLSPAYDLVASSLLLPEDKEELALTLNARKRNIKKRDFIAFAEHFNIGSKTVNNIFYKFEQKIPQWKKFIEDSFITNDLKQKYRDLIDERAEKLLK